MVEGMIATKGSNRRRVPIIPELRELLVAEIVRTGRRGDEAWKMAKLNRITLHECRHSFAALMIAAGVNANGPLRLHGPQLHSGDLRQVRPPHARQRRPGGRAPALLP